MRRVEAVGFRWFRERGGMPSIQLSPLSGRYLSFAEREEIALLNAQEAGVREITRWLGRSPATISQKLRRNGATRCARLDYREAQLMAQCPKTPKLVANARLLKYMQDRLQLLDRPAN
jgi:transposase, IS30 family